MDFQRILILLGLAATSYLLLLAWNDDYKNGPVSLTSAENSANTANQTTPSLNIVPQNDTLKAKQSFVPTLEADSDIQAQTENFETGGKTNTDRILKIQTDVFELLIDKLGGDIVSGSLPKFPASLDTPNIPFILLDPRNTYSAQSGLIGKNGTDTAKGRPLFQSEQSTYSMGEADELSVELYLPAQNGVSITKRFTFKRNNYLIDVQYIVDNQSSEDWQASLFTQIKRNSEDAQMSDVSGMGMRPFIGGATFQEGSPYTKLSFDDIEEDNYKAKVEGGYIALVQHYFVSAWVPEKEKTYTYQARKLLNQDIYLFGLTGSNWLVHSGQASTLNAQFYMGPKNQKILEEISPGLNLTVDYGFLWWLAQPLFKLLDFIHSYVNNWGVAIIILTIIVKSVLFPLSAASFRSMAKMRKLQPEMARLKERFGDDKQKFSQAMMELYKKEGANPLGGCLPMLLQMPVFLALYWSLMESVELRQAPFFLWIYDLSAMDPYFVLPILMGISMYLTQMMQPEPPDPMQAKVMKLMPVMFTFFFLWFPSGLVLYWLVNNMLSILQQTYVNRQIEKAG